jgi:hypothetical protein
MRSTLFIVMCERKREREREVEFYRGEVIKALL